MRCTGFMPAPRIQRRIDAVGALDHGALEATRRDRDVLGEEARERDARGRRAVAREGARPPAPPRRAARRRPRSRTAADRAWRRRARRRLVASRVEQPVGGAFEARRPPRRAARRSRRRRDRWRPSTACGGARELVDDRPFTVAPPDERQLAGDEVDRLDAVGAFVDRGDARVAVVLRGAGLLDIAHAAVHLHAERGDLAADVGRERLGDRREQRGALVRRLRAPSHRRRDARGRSRPRWRSRSRARRAVSARMVSSMRLTSGWAMIGLAPRCGAGRAALPALARIGERLLGGALGDADALQADRRAAPGSSW